MWFVGLLSVCIYLQFCTCMKRPEVSIRYSSGATLFCEAWLFLEMWTCYLGLAGWPEIHGHLPIPLSPWIMIASTATTNWTQNFIMYDKHCTYWAVCPTLCFHFPNDGKTINCLCLVNNPLTYLILLYKKIFKYWHEHTILIMKLMMKMLNSGWLIW